jgi:hypothetical protein
MQMHIQLPVRPTGPLDSPRTLRRQLRQSEDSSGDMSIEEYIYRCDPCRSTTLPNPMPYPLLIKPDHESFTLVEPLRAEILEILGQHGFSRKPILSVDQVTKPNYLNGDVPVTMLRIRYSLYTMAVPLCFEDAKDAIYRLLLTHNITHLHVEIVHSGRFFEPSLFAIDPIDPAVVVWDHAKEQILQLIGERLGSFWTLLSLFNLGLWEAKASPTVVVMVMPGTICDWASLEASMRYSFQSQLAVEFLPGSISLTIPPPDDAMAAPSIWKFDQMTEQGNLKMGFSIADREKRSGGSMGGFVTLTQNGITRKGILTNYHVARPAESVGEHALLQADRFGSSPCIPDSTQAEILFPHEDNIKATLRGASWRIQEIEDELRKLNAKRDLEIGRLRPSIRIKGQVDSLTDRLKEQKKKLHVVKAMPLLLGKVYISSGKSLMNNRILDWAFVELTGPATDVIFAPNESPVVSHEYPRCSILPDILSHFRYQSKLSMRFGELKKGQYCVKAGSSTDGTPGRCNGVMAYCHWSDEARIRYDECGREAKMAEGITEEYIILNKRSGGYGNVQCTFSLPGDSGSFIIDDYSQASGLLYGSFISFCGPPNGPDCSLAGAYSGLATTMPDIIKSVEARTIPRDLNGTPTGPPACLGFPK